jgi:uncharacterized protein (TIGR03067 family)
MGQVKCTFAISNPWFRSLRRDTVMKPNALKTWVGVLRTLGCGLILALETQVSAAMIPGSAEPEKDKSQAVAAELAKLQGTWQLVSSETNGKKLPEEQVKQFRVKIEKDRHTVTFGDQVVAHEVKFTVDPTTQPKGTEDTLEDEPNRGKKIRGIYLLEGDSLTSCVGAIDAPRPTEFSSKPGSGQSLRRFTRVKTVATAKPGDAEEANAQEYRAFEGTWRFVAMQVGGKDLPAEQFKTSRLIFKGHDFTAINHAGTTRGTFSVDTTKSPKAMDVTITDGSAKGAIFRNIYELKGDTYKLCGSMTSGKDRAKEFDSKPGSGYMVQVLEREKR